MESDTPEMLRERAHRLYEAGWIGIWKRDRMLHKADVREAVDEGIGRDPERETRYREPRIVGAKAGPPRWRGLGIGAGAR